MKRQFHAVIAMIITICSVAVPIIAQADDVRTFTGKTRMVEQAPSVGEFDGSLQLRISSDGIVSGYYRPNDNARFVSVTGGLTGDRLWLEIGSMSTRGWRFSGTLKDGELVASSNGLLLDGGRLTGIDLTSTLVRAE